RTANRIESQRCSLHGGRGINMRLSVHSLVAVWICLAARSLVAAGAVGDSDAAKVKAEAKRLILEVEEIRRLKPEEQAKRIEHVYRELLPRLVKLSEVSLLHPGPPVWKDRDKLPPKEWLEK